MKRTRLFRASILLTVIATALTMSLACGGGSSDPDPVIPTPPPVASSVITVTCNPYTVTTSPRAGFQFRIAFPCQIRESAGLAANFNYARVRFTRNGAEVERAEIGSADITAAAGTNRINANGTMGGTFNFDFNRGDATGGILEFNFTDDRQNNGTATLNF